MPNNPLVLIPIFIPLAGAALCILTAHYLRVQHIIGMTASTVAWLGSLAILLLNWSDGLQIYRIGGYAPPYGIVLAPDMLFSALFEVMATTVVTCGTLYILGCRDKCISYPAFMPIFLCMSAGLNGAFYTGDIFTLFVFPKN